MPFSLHNFAAIIRCRFHCTISLLKSDAVFAAWFHCYYPMPFSLRNLCCYYSMPFSLRNFCCCYSVPFSLHNFRCYYSMPFSLPNFSCHTAPLIFDRTDVARVCNHVLHLSMCDVRSRFRFVCSFCCHLDRCFPKKIALGRSPDEPWRLPPFFVFFFFDLKL